MRFKTTTGQVWVVNGTPRYRTTLGKDFVKATTATTHPEDSIEAWVSVDTIAFVYKDK